MPVDGWAIVNYYTLLGTHAGATIEVLRTSYRIAAWANHPDRSLGTAASWEAGTRFAAISAAYKTLKDSAKRCEYDARQALRYEACPTCSKGAVYVQRGYNRREAKICLRCNGSGFQEKLK